jgi:hypothetical protein
MTPDKMRVAIAEKCGWIHKEYPGKMPMGSMAGKPYYWFTHELPDYCNDLNAMHEAEKVLSESQRGTYFSHLNTMCGEYRPLFELLHATAAQRAEAFCRVFWPEKFN